MADAIARKPPRIDACRWLEPLPAATRFSLRGGDEARLAASRAFGVELPASACRAASAGGRSALWLGPDEHLLIAPEPEGPALAAALAAALAVVPHSLVDVSHRQVAFAVQGPHAEWLLGSGCPLDLDVGAFPVGMCTRTVFVKAEVLLWRTARDAFRIEVWRSFAEYVVAHLAETALERPA
ncbi:MAG TPA: sarcosine oxidase subunit gamma family protein [Steroidobacteraceae bacterium]|nr:sarcosine oxidase subunit gamma family protein [Steroidobacteraceae bacterium]